jgi:DNA-binding MarR family transcriptional regulator
MMEKTDPAHLWKLSYRLLATTIASASGEIEALGLEMKELFVLSAIEDHPHPAALAEQLVIPKPSVTAYLKRLEAAGFVKREIDNEDLRRHRLTLTATGRKVAHRGVAALSEAFDTRLGRLSAKQRGELAALLETMSEG